MVYARLVEQQIFDSMQNTIIVIIVASKSITNERDDFLKLYKKIFQ
jgi:hypothetical protein